MQKSCRLWKERKENAGHIIKCEELREGIRAREELLNDYRRGINWMKSIQER